jgi:hypothetical protein
MQSSMFLVVWSIILNPYPNPDTNLDWLIVNLIQLIIIIALNLTLILNLALTLTLIIQILTLIRLKSQISL